METKKSLKGARPGLQMKNDLRSAKEKLDRIVAAK
jgi:hypothetical protein